MTPHEWLEHHRRWVASYHPDQPASGYTSEQWQALHARMETRAIQVRHAIAKHPDGRVKWARPFLRARARLQDLSDKKKEQKLLPPPKNVLPGVEPADIDLALSYIDALIACREALVGSAK